jgi:hypothetical protein
VLGQPLGPGARPFSACARIANAMRLDTLRRPGIGAVRCRIGPGLTLAVLSDDTTSWPVIVGSGRSSVSLEDPLAKRAWFPNTSPVRVRPAGERFLTFRGRAGAPTTLVYSGFVDRIDGSGTRDVFVALRIRPQPCLLGVSSDPGEAIRLAQDANARCIPPFGTG